jgi:hypothetical protein
MAHEAAQDGQLQPQDLQKQDSVVLSKSGSHNLKRNSSMQIFHPQSTQAKNHSTQAKNHSTQAMNHSTSIPVLKHIF